MKLPQHSAGTSSGSAALLCGVQLFCRIPLATAQFEVKQYTSIAARLDHNRPVLCLCSLLLRVRKKTTKSNDTDPLNTPSIPLQQNVSGAPFCNAALLPHLQSGGDSRTYHYRKEYQKKDSITILPPRHTAIIPGASFGSAALLLRVQHFAFGGCRAPLATPQQRVLHTILPSRYANTPSQARLLAVLRFSCASSSSPAAAAKQPRPHKSRPPVTILQLRHALKDASHSSTSQVPPLAAAPCCFASSSSPEAAAPPPPSARWPPPPSLCLSSSGAAVRRFGSYL